jgi:predicted ArsR family transcriptional regulator
VTSDSPDRGLDALCTLNEPLRRALYRYVVTQHEAVSRNQAAEAVGTQRSLAAFHLDKLVDAGLLEASFRRLNNRTGPGAGRPAKLYRRAPGDHTVSLPPRAYPVAAELLAEVVDAMGADAELHAVARRSGFEIGQQARSALEEVDHAPVSPAGPGSGDMVARSNGVKPHLPPDPQPDPAAQTSAGDDTASIVDAREEARRYLEAVLAQNGFEPYDESGTLRMHNCPFHRLSRQFPPLICGMNLALVEGIVDGFGDPALRAAMDPAPDRCCVAVQADAHSKTYAD